MAQFVVEMEHTDQDCMAALKLIAEHGMHVLNHSWFACNSGVHKSWLNIEVDTPEAARLVVPPSMRRAATVTEVARMNIEDLKEEHAH